MAYMEVTSIFQVFRGQSEDKTKDVLILYDKRVLDRKKAEVEKKEKVSGQFITAESLIQTEFAIKVEIDGVTGLVATKEFGVDPQTKKPYEPEKIIRIINATEKIKHGDDGRDLPITTISTIVSNNIQAMDKSSPFRFCLWSMNPDENPVNISKNLLLSISAQYQTAPHTDQIRFRNIDPSGSFIETMIFNSLPSPRYKFVLLSGYPKPDTQQRHQGVIIIDSFLAQKSEKCISFFDSSHDFGLFFPKDFNVETINEQIGKVREIDFSFLKEQIPDFKTRLGIGDDIELEVWFTQALDTKNLDSIAKLKSLISNNAEYEYQIKPMNELIGNLYNYSKVTDHARSVFGTVLANSMVSFKQLNTEMFQQGCNQLKPEYNCSYWSEAFMTTALQFNEKIQDMTSMEDLNVFFNGEDFTKKLRENFAAILETQDKTKVASTISLQSKDYSKTDKDGGLILSPPIAQEVGEIDLKSIKTTFTPHISQPSITFSSESETTIISFKTDNTYIFRDIEEITITLPKGTKIDQEYIDNLHSDITKKGFINDYTCLDCVTVKRKGKEGHEKMGHFTNGSIMARYRKKATEKTM